MNKAAIRRSVRIYDFLLRFYPKSYRQEFGEEMKYVFSQSLKDAYTEDGGEGIISLWTRTIIDTSKSLITEHLENKTRPLNALSKANGEREGGDSMKTKNTDLIMQNKVFLWIALATGLILSIPLIAMQFTREVNWTLPDFVIMGVLLFGMGFLFVHATRAVPRKYRVLTSVAFVTLLLYIWAELAVGIFTNLGS